MKTFIRILGLVLVAIIAVWNCYASRSFIEAIADLPSVLCGLLTIWGGIEWVYDRS